MANPPKDVPPAAVLLGRELISTDAETGEIKLRFTGRRQFRNRHGTIQGGFLSAMLDSATGLAALTILADQDTAVTTSLTTLFHKPATPGAIEAVAQARRIDARSIEAKAELIAAGGAVIASATAQLRVVPRHK